jgi:hypothetical protein
MTTDEPRPPARRKADALTLLATPGVDVWVATAAGGPAHLVPLSLAWVDERVVLALEADSLTARNLAATGRARLGVGPTREVVMMDAELEVTHPVAGAPAALGEAYAAQADWDPRAAPDGYVYLVLRPIRMQAWREANELAGRTLMRGGAWVV